MLAQVLGQRVPQHHAQIDRVLLPVVVRNVELVVFHVGLAGREVHRGDGVGVVDDGIVAPVLGDIATDVAGPVDQVLARRVAGKRHVGGIDIETEARAGAFPLQIADRVPAHLSDKIVGANSTAALGFLSASASI